MMPRDDAIAANNDASRALTTPATTTDRDDRAPRVDDVFSTRRPKDLGAGLSSGLQSAAKSVALGAGALLSAPVVGAREDGARGTRRLTTRAIDYARPERRTKSSNDAPASFARPRAKKPKNGRFR